MPVCRYEILDAAQNGKPVAFAIIGQGVFHKWTCDTDTTDTFCMTVHSCFVDDGKGDRLDLLTDTGCAIDKYLMNNLEYPSDLMAVKEVHVFKYADRPVLQFQCQVCANHPNSLPMLKLFRSQFWSKTRTYRVHARHAPSQEAKVTAVVAQPDQLPQQRQRQDQPKSQVNSQKRAQPLPRKPHHPLPLQLHHRPHPPKRHHRPHLPRRYHLQRLVAVNDVMCPSNNTLMRPAHSTSRHD
jgi:hypothetical protein